MRVYQTISGWYFDDDFGECHGPFETECEAINELKKFYE